MEQYDTFEDVFQNVSVQLKLDKDRNGNPYLCDKHVWTNGPVPFKDGVYIGKQGAIMIIEGELVGVVTNVYDKWNQPINLTTFLKPRYDQHKYAQRVQDAEKQVAMQGEYE